MTAKQRSPAKERTTSGGARGEGTRAADRGTAPRKGRPSASATDRYLAAVTPEQRSALERLRKAIRSAAPRAVEGMSYGLPAFRLDGKVLVLFGASSIHCSFYPGSGTAVGAHAAALRGFKTSKGTIRFEPGKPLPPALVRKVVADRIAENARR